MLDRISSQNLSPEDRIANQATVSGAQSVSAAGNNAVESAETSSGLIADDATISSGAKEKLAQYMATKPYVQKLQSEISPIDASRVERFKAMLANGGVDAYLEETLPQVADKLLASPEGKTLKASLR